MRKEEAALEMSDRSDETRLPVKGAGRKRHLRLRQGEYQPEEREVQAFMAQRSCLQRCLDRRPPRQQMWPSNEIKSTK